MKNFWLVVGKIALVQALIAILLIFLKLHAALEQYMLDEFYSEATRGIIGLSLSFMLVAYTIAVTGLIGFLFKSKSNTSR